MKKFVFALALLAALAEFSLFASPKVQKSLPFSKGINVPVWMEGTRLNSGLYGKSDFENIRRLGVEVVRLPVWFEIWNEGAPDYKVSPECFDIIDKAVSWCQELGMFLIIDFHNDCNGSSKTNPKIEQVLLKVWPQIAARYKDKDGRVIYEIMNEPHFGSGNVKADIAKWAKIQGNVLKAIREVDQRHSVIVSGGDWDSLDSMLALPDYGDQNLIYNFHDYSPFLFTHQGAPWTYLKRVTKIPFPYSKEKMPPLPKGATEQEKAEFKNYPNASSEETLCAPLDKAVEFANKRGAALMCNEFGVSLKYADPAERVNWYRLKCGWMDERGIVRVSWDYTQEFGLFNTTSETRFPQDLNAPLVEAMGFKVPAGKGDTWLSRAQKSGDWTIYKNGSAGLARLQAYSMSGSLAFKESGSDEACIAVKDIAPYAELGFLFGEACDLSALAESGAALEFYMKSKDKALDLSVYFRDMEAKIFPWRAAANIKAGGFKADGQWHKVSIPLKNLADIGGWTQATNWKNGEKKFTWTLVDSLTFQNGAAASKDGYMVKDIKIVR